MNQSPLETSIQTTEQQNVESPFSDVPTSILADTLEAQYETGTLDSRIVFEVVNRLLKSEGLVTYPDS